MRDSTEGNEHVRIGGWPGLGLGIIGAKGISSGRNTAGAVTSYSFGGAGAKGGGVWPAESFILMRAKAVGSEDAWGGLYWDPFAKAKGWVPCSACPCGAP